MKDKIINIIRHKNTVGIVLALLVVSVIANAYFLIQRALAPTINPLVTNTGTTTTAVISSPYGFRNEVITLYDGKQTKTYSTTTPIAEPDVREIRDSVILHQKMIAEYLRKQDQLFRSFWYKF